MDQLVLLNFVPDRASWTANERLGIGEPGLPGVARRHAVERMLRACLARSGKGTVDGGGGGIDGRSDIFLYGQDAEALWADIEPLVRTLLDDADCQVLIRQGDADDDNAPERGFRL